MEFCVHTTKNDTINSQSLQNDLESDTWTRNVQSLMRVCTKMMQRGKLTTTGV